MALKFTVPVTNALPDSVDAGITDSSFRVQYQRDSDGKLDPVKRETYLSASFGYFDSDGVQRGGQGVNAPWPDLPDTVKAKLKQLSSAIIAWAIATGRLPAGAEEGDL